MLKIWNVEMLKCWNVGFMILNLKSLEIQTTFQHFNISTFQHFKISTFHSYTKMATFQHFNILGVRAPNVVNISTFSRPNANVECWICFNIVNVDMLRLRRCWNVEMLRCWNVEMLKCWENSEKNFRCFWFFWNFKKKKEKKKEGKFE